MTELASPAASGPAGPHFEAEVGAYYLLSLLTQSEARGLPGTAVNRVSFGKAADGNALDDIVVSGSDSKGGDSIFEIQVKRTITFTPGDAVFRKVAGQIAKSATSIGFYDTRHELGIAVARTTSKIEGPYRDVLTWARAIGDETTFFSRLSRPKLASDPMRTFVNTLKENLNLHGAPIDHGSIWKILRRLQILPFDFPAPGSASRQFAMTRAALALHPDDALFADSLWSKLIDLVQRRALAGGDFKREELQDELRSANFRLVGDRKFVVARTHLHEASLQALADISSQIGKCALLRQPLVSKVKEALDQGRFVTIVGDAGVGKSAVLKNLALELAAESRIAVLSPGRVTPRGWLEFRTRLGFDGEADQLMCDLAADGGAVLFIDNLDLFSDEERTTVCDLVRAAARVPHFSIVATARRNPDSGQSWLPEDALDLLQRAPDTIVGELSDAEVEEIRQGDPSLAALLSDGHVAHGVTRNLFRLSLLAKDAVGASQLRTEIDMACRWWETADGKQAGLRERARTLRSLASKAIATDSKLKTDALDADAVDELVLNQTVHDFGNDRVAFRHDIFREWAIACLLEADPQAINLLPLKDPANVFLSRAMDLFSRILLERDTDIRRWRDLVGRLEQSECHGSWARSAKLALVRSERGIELLPKVAAQLLAQDGKALRDLLRLVQAVEVEKPGAFHEAFGIDVTKLPANFVVPIPHSWGQLLGWLFSVEGTLPSAVIPEVANAYISWSQGWLGIDPLTPIIQTKIGGWLTLIDDARDAERTSWADSVLGERLWSQRLRSLESDLRNSFALFGHRIPSEAADYLRKLVERKNGRDAMEAVVQFSGHLGRAAPAELAAVVRALYLKSDSNEDESDYDRDRDSDFRYFDRLFFPPSAKKGPFLSLLQNSPVHGLELVRDLVKYAVSLRARRQASEAESVTILLSGKARQFRWKQTYFWSRHTGECSSVSCALMALEEWSHERIEKGTPIGVVLQDILGPQDSECAFLLVAVDLFLCNWPASRAVAPPFVGAPELLCLEQERHALDPIGRAPGTGSQATNEPSVEIAGQSSKISRWVTLDCLLSRYALGPTDEAKAEVVGTLKLALGRLEAPNRQSTLADPALMATHALNQLNATNWPECEVLQSDGSTRRIRKYVPPESERAHFATFESEVARSLADSNIQARLRIALNDRKTVAPELVKSAILWAREYEVGGESEDKTERSIREQAILTAAMVVARDGDDEALSAHEDWVAKLLFRTLLEEVDSVVQMRSGLSHNPIAIAFVGMAHLAVRRSCDKKCIRGILDAASRSDYSSAHGFAEVAAILAEADGRLPRAVLRCGLVGRLAERGKPPIRDSQMAQLRARKKEEAAHAVQREVDWLSGNGAEPEWPEFPKAFWRQRRRTRIPSVDWNAEAPPERPQRSRPDRYVDQRGAAIWISAARHQLAAGRHPWLSDLVRRYAPWTASANGLGADASEDSPDGMREWNNVFYFLSAHCLARENPDVLRDFIAESICALPDEPFFDVVSEFVYAFDLEYSACDGVSERSALGARQQLLERLFTSYGWRRLKDDPSCSMETHIAPAISSLLFNIAGFGQPPRCYLNEKGIDRLDAFLPLVGRMAAEGPSLLVAGAVLNLLEISLRPQFADTLLVGAKAWLHFFPNDSRFWIDYGVGTRVCKLLDKLFALDPKPFLAGTEIRLRTEEVLSGLIVLGIPEANEMERSLVGRKSHSDNA